MYKTLIKKWYNTISSGTKFETMSSMKEKLAVAMGVNYSFRTTPPDRSHLIKYLPQSQEELPKRTMQDSFLVGILPLSSERSLQDKYINFLGRVRLGRLLEDMDIFSVMVARKFILNPSLPEDTHFPQTLVTVTVDQIDFTDYVPSPHIDIRLAGHVSWVGKTSLEVIVWLEQENNSKWEKITKALFVLAARDPTNTKASFVNPIVATNEQEKIILASGEDRKNRRKLAEETHVSKLLPTVEELNIIHDIYKTNVQFSIGTIMKRKSPETTEWMGEHFATTTIFSHPENRNLHNNVFGGFLMRNAVEISSILGYRYCKQLPKLKTMRDIRFKKPLAISSLPSMHAYVVYTFANYLQIMVVIEKLDIDTKVSETTNTFHLTFESSTPVKEAMPLSYHEAMMYIDGRRHFLQSNKEIQI